MCIEFTTGQLICLMLRSPWPDGTASTADIRVQHAIETKSTLKVFKNYTLVIKGRLQYTSGTFIIVCVLQRVNIRNYSEE